MIFFVVVVAKTNIKPHYSSKLITPLLERCFFIAQEKFKGFHHSYPCRKMCLNVLRF